MIPTKDKLIVEKSGELDDWGRPTGTEIEEYSCRIDYKTEIVKNERGEEKVSRATILVKGFALITTEDTLKWSDGYGDNETTAISVSPIKDFSGKTLFTKVVV